MFWGQNRSNQFVKSRVNPFWKGAWGSNDEQENNPVVGVQPSTQASTPKEQTAASVPQAPVQPIRQIHEQAPVPIVQAPSQIVKGALSSPTPRVASLTPTPSAIVPSATISQPIPTTSSDPSNRFSQSSTDNSEVPGPISNQPSSNSSNISSKPTQSAISNNKVLIASSIAGSFVFLLICLCFYLRRRKKMRKEHDFKNASVISYFDVVDDYTAAPFPSQFYSQIGKFSRIIMIKDAMKTTSLTEMTISSDPSQEPMSNRDTIVTETRSANASTVSYHTDIDLCPSISVPKLTEDEINKQNLL